MKQTVEIDVPDGFEIERIKILDDCALVDFKKKQTKDFDWFVDQYLSEHNVTVDFITGWIPDRDIELARQRLKTKQFDLVCWEIKIGLFRFILLEHKMPASDITNFHISYGGGGDIGRSRFCKIIDICPIAFLDSLFG